MKPIRVGHPDIEVKMYETDLLNPDIEVKMNVTFHFDPDVLVKIPGTVCFDPNVDVKTVDNNVGMKPPGQNLGRRFVSLLSSPQNNTIFVFGT